MSRRKITKNTAADKGTRGSEPIPWRYCLLTLVCGFFLVVGFFGAARQHFSSIDLGIKNSKLRKQAEELEAEQRRLLLTKEVVLSPGEIKKAAKKIGFTEMSASNIEVFRNAPDSQQKTVANKVADAKVLKENSNSGAAKKDVSTKDADARKNEKPADSAIKKDKPKTQIAKK